MYGANIGSGYFGVEAESSQSLWLLSASSSTVAGGRGFITTPSRLKVYLSTGTCGRVLFTWIQEVRHNIVFVVFRHTAIGHLW